MKSNKELLRIKTKYETKEECLEQCRDHKGWTRFDWMIIMKISGEVYPDGSFELTAMARAGACQIFRGRIKQEEDGIYMEGRITPKIFVKRFLIVCAVITALVSPIYVYYLGWWGTVFMLAVFSVIAWNFALMYFSESLKKQIIRKVS